MKLTVGLFLLWHMFQLRKTTSAALVKFNKPWQTTTSTKTGIFFGWVLAFVLQELLVLVGTPRRAHTQRAHISSLADDDIDEDLGFQG